MTWVLLALSSIAGASYPFFFGLPLWAMLALKGAPVALLALWAAVQAHDRDGWLLTAVLALGAIGDVLLEVHFTAGAVSFALGHAVAIWLYLRNRLEPVAASMKLLALALALLIVEVSFLLPDDRAAAPGAAFYATLLAVMAASAWFSRFPRALTGVGALLFVASDLLILARMGPLRGMFGLGLAIWWLYYAGQLLIALGVRRSLHRAAA